MILEERPVEPDEASVGRIRGRLESARAELEREPGS